MPSSALRVVFFVQGEGRGHMTQALALRGMLQRAGHEVAEVLVGRSARREVPAFFTDKIDAPLTYFDSPNFLTDGRNQGIRLGRSVRYNLRKRGVYRHNLEIIDRRLRVVRPDVVVNFYEPLCGLYQLLYPSEVPSVAVGHQYLFEHSAFTFPAGHYVDRAALLLFNQLTAIGASRRLALAFEPHPDVPEEQLHVVPPLLRAEVFAQRPSTGEHLLVYLLNSGYAGDIIAWHERHPAVPLHCFWDRTDVPDVLRHDETLTFHRLDDEKFLRLMASCRGLVATAGFEAVCEAMYLGKPVLMVPVRGHFEQQCNARDAERAGAGLRSTRFDLSRFLRYLPHHQADADAFRVWAREAPARIVGAIEACARHHETPYRLSRPAAFATRRLLQH